MPRLSSGVLVLDLGGQVVEVEGSFSVQTSRIKREAVSGESGRIYTKTTPNVPMIEGEILVDETITPAWYESLNGVRGSCRLRDGRVYAFVGLTSDAEFKHDAVAGKLPINCFCDDIEQTA
jgi:hypothetical protein